MPAARLLAQLGIESPGFGAVAVMVVIGSDRVRLPSSAEVPAARAQRPSQEAHIVGPAAIHASRRRSIWALVSG